MTTPEDRSGHTDQTGAAIRKLLEQGQTESFMAFMEMYEAEDREIGQLMHTLETQAAFLDLDAPGNPQFDEAVIATRTAFRRLKELMRLQQEQQPILIELMKTLVAKKLFTGALRTKLLANCPLTFNKEFPGDIQRRHHEFLERYAKHVLTKP